MLGGWTPTGPNGYLNLGDTTERLVADSVIEEADKLWHERFRAFCKNIEAAVQTGVARAFGGS